MLSVRDVSMIYQKGKKEALKNINLEIAEGEFTALLGQNGAGKSTLINILAGNVKKTQGSVSIGGYDLDKKELETKKIIGIVPQDTGYDFVFTVDEALKKQSGYFGIKNNKAYIDEVLEALYLTEKRSARIRDLSGGMRRRFLIAKALVHKPKILILDEPTAGVDIEMRHTLYDFLVKLHQSGTTIILTTHYIEEAEKLCKRIVIIDGGKIIADEPKEELMDAFSRESIIEVHFDQALNLADFDFLSDYHPRIEDKTRLQLKASKKTCPKSLGNYRRKT
ncbi:ABC transporter ATP-binding protein [Acetobacterium wieringae]|uniref:ABC transporter ATP-binding protein n=1 Tax=Acetobacterium wieringae TaxID=52694 RepID=UPI002033209B|nr:ABC transporter ATP-binding protein [Acetobacterium wieringae]URN84705.1 ABC transporter ATP-binding protein [Acetobacterium wieringae]